MGYDDGGGGYGVRVFPHGGESHSGPQLPEMAAAGGLGRARFLKWRRNAAELSGQPVLQTL